MTIEGKLPDSINICTKVESLGAQLDAVRKSRAKGKKRPYMEYIEQKTNTVAK